ncbi:MAG: PilZ domain-containing protein [Thermoanaerobaculia bacterium]
MERRLNKRMARRVQVRFWDAADEEPRSGYTINVSPTGLFVGTNRPLPPGSKVRLAISLGEREVTIDGIVVHAARVSPLLQKLRPSGMGVRFDQEHLELRHLLKPGA